MTPVGETRLVIERLRKAWNDHDLEAFVDLFDGDYESRWPIHPDRDFDGVAPVRERWSGNFKRMPDFTAELLGLAVDGERAWTEWRWSGTRPDGSRFDEQGPIVYTVRGRRIVAGRLYLEPRPNPTITPGP